MKVKLHYAWVILFITFLSLLAVQGVRLSFGAFVEPWEKDFSMNRGTVSLISTLSFIVYGLSQPMIGKLVDKFGARLILSASTFLVAISILLTAFVHHPWQLFILYGVLVSIGVGGASNVAAAVVVTNWFNEKRGLALGIVEVGFGAGQMLLVPGSLMLIQWIDWKWTVVILGSFLMVIVFPIVLADRWSSRKMLFFLYITRALSMIILLYNYNPTLLIIFAIIFGLVDFATVAPTQLLATQYFKQYSVGFIVGWLFLSHQIGSALGAYLPGLLYNETGNYNLSFYFSIIFLVGASIFNVLLLEPNEAKKTQKINLNQSHTTN